MKKVPNPVAASPRLELFNHARTKRYELELKSQSRERLGHGFLANNLMKAKE